MRVIVDFPVRAKGRPKGHSSSKIIVGYLSEEFKLEENDDPMVKAIELKSPYANIEYLQNGDGHCYRRTTSGRETGTVGEGHHFPALYNGDGNPFIDLLAKDVRESFRKMSEAEINKDYFPKELCDRVRYSHSRLLNIATAVIENLELRNDSMARAATQASVSEHIVSRGDIYRRVPEPCFGVSLEDNRVKIKQWVYNSFAEFEKVLLNDKSTLAFFNLSDLNRAQEFTRDLAEQIGADYGGESISYSVEQYSPITSYADDLTLYRIGRHIEASVTDNMMRGATSTVLSKLLDWNNTTLGMLRDLTVALNKKDWMAESPALERIIGSCIEYDANNRTQTFTKPVPSENGSFNFTLAYSQWQLREFSAPSLRR